MPYAVELSREADAIFDSLPVDVAICVNEELYRLAEAPLAIGRPSHFPYILKGYIHDFWCDCTEKQWFIVTFFDFEPANGIVQVQDFSVRSYEGRNTDDD